MAPSPAEAAEPGGDPAGPGDDVPALFRVPPAALVAAVFLALCLSPIAFQGGAWFALFALPLALALLVLWVRTTVDAEGLHVRLVTTTNLPWSQVATLRVADRRWVRAVPVEGVRGGRELTLVCVRLRDLGRLGEASGGRIRVPTPAEAQAAEEHQRELEAARMRVERLRELQAPAGAGTTASGDEAHDETGGDTTADTDTDTDAGAGTDRRRSG